MNDNWWKVDVKFDPTVDYIGDLYTCESCKKKNGLGLFRATWTFRRGDLEDRVTLMLCVKCIEACKYHNEHILGKVEV